LQEAGNAPVQLAPGEAIEYPLDGTSNRLVIQLQPPASHRLLDPLIYAPAIPGVIVALAGLAIAHYLTKRLDRRREANNLSLALQKSAQDAAKSAIHAWGTPKDDARQHLIFDVKRELQALGIAATQLKRRTHTKIDVVKEVAALRTAATADPFEDPEREADQGPVGNIQSALSTLLVAITEKCDRYYS